MNDQNISQSHTADQIMEPRGRANNTNNYKTSGRHFKQSNQLKHLNGNKLVDIICIAFESILI